MIKIGVRCFTQGQWPMFVPLGLLFSVVLSASAADLPISFILLPDGPPYSLLDLPVPKISPPYPNSIEIDRISPDQRLQISAGNLFVKVPNNDSRWASMQADVQFQVCFMLLPNAESHVERHPSYSAPLFNISLSQMNLVKLIDDAIAAGSREMCLLEMSATVSSSSVKCLSHPPPQLAQDEPESTDSCYVYMTSLRNFPFAFDATSVGSIITGAVYSVSIQMSIIGVSSPNLPKIDIVNHFSSFSCETFIMFRRHVSFAYLVQAEGDFDDSIIQSDDSVVLLLQWRHLSPCKTAQNRICVFHPNSTVNSGRNHLLQQLLQRFPGVHPNFVIFMDEDARLLLRGDSSIQGSEWEAQREYERLLLQWQPAIGVPYHSWHSINEDVAVQTVDHFDHIVVALHDEVVDYYLPTETRFDNMCWWYGQAIYSIISTMFFPNNTLQFNTIVSINSGTRPLYLDGVAELSTKYKKRTDFYHSLTWIMSSVKSLPLLKHIEITIEASLFTFGTLANKGNRFTASPRPSGGHVAAVGKHLPGLIDCCHPYWMKHGLRTLYAGPMSLWNPDTSSNDWLMQTSSMNCYEYSARNLECNQTYAPAVEDIFRTEWLHYRLLKQLASENEMLKNQVMELDMRLRKLEMKTSD